MEFHNWKIFDKKGSNVNWYIDPFLPIEFVSDLSNSRGAKAYALTDPSAIISDVVVTNSGYNYLAANTVAVVNYTFGESHVLSEPTDVSINYIDVSIFAPEPDTVQGIGSLNIDVSTEFIYPSISYAGSLFLTPVATGLVETEHLTILQDTSIGYRRPYAANSEIIVRMVDAPDIEISLFEIDEVNQIIEWSDEIIFDTSIISALPLTINIGFRAETEGIFERRLRIYERLNGTDEALLSEILVNAQSISHDERFDTILQDVAPSFNPKNFPHLFKRANINEALPDWELVNEKSRNMVLDYSHITPFIGTYKALINSIKWLGYEDIKIKEWFRDVKENKKLSLYVPYEAAERTKTILYFSPEERRNLKKLNELSLIYCINRETGEIDEWGNPETENCYEYNLDEILTKLFSLKDWLERKVIGVNARITDLTGEGVYFERFRNLLYGTQDFGHRGILEQSLTPMLLSDRSELITGDASVDLTLKELNKLEIKELKYRFKDLMQYGYSQDPSYYDGSTGTYNTIEVDSSILNDFDASVVRVGSTFRFPSTLYDIEWKMETTKPTSGVLSSQFVTNPLWVYENTLRFYNIFDEQSIFYDISTNLNVVLNTAYLRDPSIDNWVNSIAYSIYPDPDPSSNSFWMESSTGVLTEFFGNATFASDSSASYLKYELDANYLAPLLSFSNYKYTDASNSISSFSKPYYLDILDGYIKMDTSIVSPSSTVEYTTQTINFSYDSSLDEQSINLDVIYDSGRMNLYVYDPSEYYYKAFLNKVDPFSSLVVDNSIYNMHINHIGDYSIKIFGWDGYNTLFNNVYYDGDGEQTYEVWTKYPTILSYIDSSVSVDNVVYDASYNYLTSFAASELYESNSIPIFDRLIPLQGLEFKTDGDGRPYIKVPSITAFQDLPASGTTSRFYNLTERVTSITDPVTIEIDPDYQSFLIDDSINVILFNKANYNVIDQSTNVVTNVVGTTLTLNDALGSNFVIDDSTLMYIQNESSREVSNIVNDNTNRTVTLDVSNYTFVENQLVNIIIEDTVSDYSWGSAFRVIDSLNGAHNLEGNIPQFVVDASDVYNLYASHAFTTYSTFQIGVDSATETNNTFRIYHDDTYYHQYYLDSTFVIMNILFDQDKVINQWYDSSDNLINDNYYPYSKAIEVDVSTLVAFRAIYDPSNYMLNQKNIWSVSRHEDNKLIMQVFNDSLFYIFDEIGTYNVKIESYDYYGNLKSKSFEGLIKII